MSKLNYENGQVNESVGKKFLKSLGYKEIKKNPFYDSGSFDFYTKEIIFEIKSKKISSSRKYTFDFTKKQLEEYNQSKRKIKILVLLVRSQNEIDKYFFDMEDFQDVNRKSQYKVFNNLERIRLTLKKEKRKY